MTSSAIFWALLLIPAAGSGICLLLRTPRAVLLLVCAGVLGSAVLAFCAAARALACGGLVSPGEWFFLDALSAYHLMIMMAVFSLSSLYTLSYFRREAQTGEFTPRLARRFGALWFGALAAMTLVLISNNLGIMWVGIEATTLVTAFLICLHRSPASLEAMWKYIIICSVGVAFAFMGTLLVGASTARQLPAADALLWTKLYAASGALNPVLLKAGFLFLLVGYGTKAGLAPMHSWLPDAHSQAPSPVSALFSGFLLNAALYCILRYVPLVERATNYSGWSLRLLALFGAVSILTAAAFIYFQRDVKRLLAYSSVEHIGIVALGMGLGGAGALGALFHMLNHSLAKTLAFFSAGRLGQMYGTHDMDRISGALRAAPVWGKGLLLSLLCLIGVAPFAIFMSELQIVSAAAAGGAWWTMGLFLFGVGVVFVGALKHAVSMSWGAPAEGVKEERADALEAVLAFAPMAALLALGLWMPAFLRDAIVQAAAIVGGRP
ncbi:MAG: proton-conducting transporter membrane subunit [Candidatus Brocadiia bacterium]